MPELLLSLNLDFSAPKKLSLMGDCPPPSPGHHATDYE